MLDPKPVSLTQVDTEDYSGTFAPEPLLVVGDIPGGGGGVDEATVQSMINNTSGILRGRVIGALDSYIVWIDIPPWGFSTNVFTDPDGYWEIPSFQPIPMGATLYVRISDPDDTVSWNLNGEPSRGILQYDLPLRAISTGATGDYQSFTTYLLDEATSVTTVNEQMGEVTITPSSIDAVEAVSSSPLGLWLGTQVEYDAIPTPDSHVVYVIVG